MNDVSTRADCIATCKRFVSLGLEYVLLPIYSSPHSSTTWWQSKVEVDQTNAIYNIGVRGGQNGLGGFTAFAIRVEEDLNFQKPLHEVPAYQFLRDLGTLRFEAGNMACFVFKCDRFVTISEHRDKRERIYSEPLKDAQLVSESGWLGAGTTRGSYGRSVRVTSEGELCDFRKFPALVDALAKTGRFHVSVSNAYLASDISGPPLL